MAGRVFGEEFTPRPIAASGNIRWIILSLNLIHPISVEATVG
jgi:hypothetical protein